MLTLALGVALMVVAPVHSYAAINLRVTPSNPVAGEYIKITGEFGTSVSRPVRLQYWNGSTWSKLAEKKTSSTGAFTFRTRAKAPSRKFRAYAPRATVKGRTYQSTASDPRTVRTVTPTATLRFVPAPIGQQKADPRKSNLTPGTARFTPVRKGRIVVVRRRLSDGSWKQVASGSQSGTGAFAFNVAASSGQVFRAVTVAANGAPAKNTPRTMVAHATRAFNDNFDTFDTATWGYRMEGSRAANSRQCSESSRESVSVESGKLKLQTKEIPLEDWGADEVANEANCPEGQYYNGHIGTAGKFDFKHGIMAARIKMQRSQGHHGGFWSQPTTNPEIGAEIDAVEFYGNRFNPETGAYTSRIQHTIYRQAVEVEKVVKNRNYLLRDGRTWADDFHIFSVQWTPTQYIFRIDGVETFRTARGVSETNQYLILSLLSSKYELENMKPTTDPMYIDWVRVWQN